MAISGHGVPRRDFRLTAGIPAIIPPNASGDVLQGAAADCNSAGETHAWFDSRVAHHHPIPMELSARNGDWRSQLRLLRGHHSLSIALSITSVPDDP